MVHVIFDGSNLRLTQIAQTGGGTIAHFDGFPYQRGYGVIGGRQRGRGVGAILRTLWRHLRPLAQSAKPIAMGALKEMGKEGLESGARALNAIAEGQKVGDALVTEGKEGAKRLAEKAVQRLQRGQGRKRKRATKAKVTLLPSDVIGKTVPQKAILNKARRDILGTY
jgi:hypothetical protein